MNKRKLIGVLITLLLIASGITGGYLYFYSDFFHNVKKAEQLTNSQTSFTRTFLFKIYYPVNNRLHMEERNVQVISPDVTIAEAVVQEYLKGPADPILSVIPKHAHLNGVYKGADDILYVDLSDEFRRNFKGDVPAEFLLLKGLFQSLVTNVGDFSDVKVLIDGKEIESLGGHFYLLYPLRDLISIEIS